MGTFGGHLEALKFLRGLDPPCPWDEELVRRRQRRASGSFEVGKDSEPPCPWDKMTCSEAAEEGTGSLKWLLDQDPPCPWDEWTCSERRGGHLDILMGALSGPLPLEY